MSAADKNFIFQTAADKDLDFVKECWSICFGDTKAFIDWNFAHNYDPGNTVLAVYGGQPCGAMQCIPYNLEFNNIQIPATYLSGVGTIPAYRGKGIAINMINYALSNKLIKDNSFLISAADSLYLKAGYKIIGYRCIYRTKNISGTPLSELPRDNGKLLRLIEKLDQIYTNDTKKHIHVKRTANHWHKILTELTKVSGGILYLTPNGYAAAYPQNDSEFFEIYECCGNGFPESDFHIIKKEAIMARWEEKYNDIFSSSQIYAGCIL